jgi:hypothetical protein
MEISHKAMTTMTSRDRDSGGNNRVTSNIPVTNIPKASSGNSNSVSYGSAVHSYLPTCIMGFGKAWTTYCNKVKSDVKAANVMNMIAVVGDERGCISLYNMNVAGGPLLLCTQLIGASAGTAGSNSANTFKIFDIEICCTQEEQMVDSKLNVGVKILVAVHCSDNVVRLFQMSSEIVTMLFDIQKQVSDDTPKVVNDINSLFPPTGMKSGDVFFLQPLLHLRGHNSTDWAVKLCFIRGSNHLYKCSTAPLLKENKDLQNNAKNKITSLVESDGDISHSGSGSNLKSMSNVTGMEISHDIYQWDEATNAFDPYSSVISVKNDDMCNMELIDTDAAEEDGNGTSYYGETGAIVEADTSVRDENDILTRNSHVDSNDKLSALGINDSSARDLTSSTISSKQNGISYCNRNIVRWKDSLILAIGSLSGEVSQHIIFLI